MSFKHNTKNSNCNRKNWFITKNLTCDQGSNNKSAIKALGATESLSFFTVQIEKFT